MSQHEEPQHPPNQEKSDDCADNVTDPLAGSFGISEIEHNAIVAFARYSDVRSQVGVFDGVFSPLKHFYKLCGVEFVLSHPCARKKAQGWGTERLYTICKNASKCARTR
jgi:hypothetical protein